MKIKIYTGALGIISFVLAMNSAMASQIPAGYVLVPAETFFGENLNSTTPVASSKISPTKSSLRVNDEINYVGVGETPSTVTATLRDEQGNPIAGNPVSLISSRVTDVVKNLQATTNTNGEAIFQVIANEEGVSSFTAVTENQTITERPRVVFLKSAGGIGGEFLAASALGGRSDSAVNQITAIFPESMIANTSADITVEIRNTNGEIMEDFSDTISFESSDTLAILPQDYTFTELDYGSHTFANAVTFTSEGNQTITIDSNAVVVAKEVSVKVADSVEDIETPIITSPASRALLNKDVVLLGFAPANSNLAVFANGQFLAESESDNSGKFSIEINLLDGEHEITIAVLGTDNSIVSASETITLTVDQVTPTIEEVSLDPGNKVMAGSLVKINVQSESGLKNVQLYINDTFIELVEKEESGIYAGEFIASTTNGAHLLKVELTDRAGNTGEFPEAVSLFVETKITISHIETVSEDGSVDLSWAPPANNLDIKNYEILYGTDVEQLDSKFTTLDNRSNWLIDELQNNTNYFFQVFSLDGDGNRNGGSEIFNATPTTTFTATSCNGKVNLKWKTSTDPRITSYQLDYGVESGIYTESRSIPNGTSHNTWEVSDLINGVEYFFALRGTDDFGQTVQNLGAEISAIPNAEQVCENNEEEIQLWQREDKNGDLILVWNEVVGATSYRVHAGTQPNFFDLPTIEISGTSFRPKGLSSNKNYFFAVSAVYAGSHNAAALSNLTRVEVGPRETLLISALVALVATFLFRRKNYLGNLVK